MKVLEVNTYSCQPTLADQKRKVVCASNIADACDIYFEHEGRYPEQVSLIGVTLLKFKSYVED